MTDVRQAQNRMNFNQAEEEYIDGDEVGAHREPTAHSLMAVWGASRALWGQRAQGGASHAPAALPCSTGCHAPRTHARARHCSAQVVGLGLLGKEGSGRLRMVATQSKLKLSAKNAKKARQAGYGGATSGLQTSGLTTSLAFTPVQVRAGHGKERRAYRAGGPWGQITAVPAASSLLHQ